MNQLKFSFILFMAAFFMSVGCTKEDLSVCNADIYLKIGFLNETKSHSSLDTITVYLYDDNTNVLVNQFSTPFTEVIANDSLVRVDVPKSGTYNFVVLGDATDEYFNYDSIENFEEITIALDDRGQSEVDWQIGNIYHGLVEDAVIVTEQSRIFDVTLTQNNKDIYIKCNGLQSIVQIGDLRVDYDDKVINTFNNTPLSWDPEDCKISYTPVGTHIVEDYDFRFNTLRLFNGDKMYLHYTLSSIGGVFRSDKIDLLSIIKKNPKYKTQLDLDIEYQFFLELNFELIDGELTLISVTVNDWTVILVKPEL